MRQRGGFGGTGESGRRLGGTLISCVLAGGLVLADQDETARAPTADDRPAAESSVLQPFARNALGIELGLGAFRESWDLNGPREWALDGTIAVWWTFAPRVSLVVETHLTRVFQDTVSNAFVTGFVPVVRVQVFDRGVWDLFAEVGPGVSWSDRTVPAAGTRFNFLAVAGGGVSRRIGSQVSLTTGLRWFHLSNGRGWFRAADGYGNPDAQTVGGYSAMTVAF